MEDFETTIKVIIVGSSGVGKSSLTRRFVRGDFQEQHKATVGVDFAEKRIEINCEDVTLMLWDTAPVFNGLTQKYYSGASVAVICFSAVDRASFDDVESWHEKLKQECGAKVLTVLVQNKMDMADGAQVTSDEVEELARKLKLRLYRSCCKDDVNVRDIFMFLAERYIATGGGGDAVSTIEQLNAMSPVKDTAPPPGPPSGGGASTAGGAMAAAATTAPVVEHVVETGVDPDHAAEGVVGNGAVGESDGVGSDEATKQAATKQLPSSESQSTEKKGKPSKQRTKGKKKKCAVQ